MFHELLWRENACCQNKYIARESHDRKVKKYVPMNICRCVPNLNSLTLTSLACTSLSSSSHKSAAGISCLDHNKRLQADKRFSSMRTKQLPGTEIVGSFTFFNTQTTFQLLRTTKRQTIVHTILFWSANNCTARPYFCPINLVVSRCLCIFRSQSEFSAKFTDNAFCARNHCSLCNIS